MRARKASERVVFFFSYLAPRLAQSWLTQLTTLSFASAHVLSGHQMYPNGAFIAKTGARMTGNFFVTHEALVDTKIKSHTPDNCPNF